MRYTAYLSRLIKENGQPNFTDEQFQKAMNVIALENRIDGIVRSKKTLSEKIGFIRELEYLQYLEECKLKNITKNWPDEQFWDWLLTNKLPKY